MTTATRTDVGYRLERVGLVMEPQPGNDLEVEGVLNPGSGRGPDGQLYLLPRIVAAMDDPAADYAAIPSWFLARRARQDVKVVLSGEGGDEIFAGYGRYRSAARPWWLGA